MTYTNKEHELAKQMAQLSQRVGSLEKENKDMKVKIKLQFAISQQLIKILDKYAAVAGDASMKQSLCEFKQYGFKSESCDYNPYWKYVGYTAISLVGLAGLSVLCYKVYKYYRGPLQPANANEIPEPSDDGGGDDDGNNQPGETARNDDSNNIGNTPILSPMLSCAASMPVLHHTSSVLSTEQQEDSQLHRTYTTLSQVPSGRYMSSRKRSAIELKKAELKSQDDTSSGTPTSRATSCGTMVLYEENKLYLESINSQPPQLQHDSISSEPLPSGNDVPQVSGGDNSGVTEYSDSMSSQPSQTSQVLLNTGYGQFGLELTVSSASNAATHALGGGSSDIAEYSDSSHPSQTSQVLPSIEQEHSSWDIPENSDTPPLVVSPQASLEELERKSSETDLIEFSSSGSDPQNEIGSTDNSDASMGDSNHPQSQGFDA